MITKTKFNSKEEFVKLRNNDIGGTDASTIVGLNQYNSAYSLWCEKTGKIVPEDISDKEAVRLGTDLEQYVAQRFMEATGKKVQRTNYIYHNDEYPFAHASPDRMVVGENAGLECKTTSSWEIAQQLRNGEIPKNWYCQIMHYLMVTGTERWYLGVLAFSVGFFNFTIERNEAEIAALAQAEKDFWELVTSNTPPTIDGSEATTEALKTIYAESNGTSVDLTAVSASIDIYNSVAKQIKELTAIQDEAANTIKEYMGEAEKGTFGDTSISWKSGTRSTFDKKRYEDAHGKIPAEFYNTTDTRTFRVTVKKGA